MSRPRLAAALATALASLSLPAWAQSIPAPSTDAGGLPRLVSSVPAEPGDVPGVSLAYEEPRPVAQTAPSVTGAGYRAYGQYIFTNGRLGADANGGAIRSSSDGFTVGIEKAVDPSFVVGASFGYTQGRGSSNGVRSTSESFGGAAYAWWNPVGGLEVDALLGGNSLDVDTRRAVTLGGAPAVLGGRVGGLGFSGLVATGYRFRLDALTVPSFVKPFVSLAYANQDRPGYSETTAGGGLYFPGKLFERAATNVGLAAGADIPFLGGTTLRPEVSVSWSRFLIDPSPSVAVFDITTGRRAALRDPRPGQDGLLVATEVALWDTPGVQGFVGYTGEFRGNATVHQGRVGLRTTW